jgi:Na+/H+ antiporter NhaC
MARPHGRETIAASASTGRSEVLQWMPRLRLAAVLLIVIALAVWFGWGSFLEW